MVRMAKDELPTVRAVDPRSLEIHGTSCKPVAFDGQVVIYDAGRPGEVKDGDAVVVQIEGDETPLHVMRRNTNKATRIYTAINETMGITPIIIAPGNVREYPIVAIYWEWENV